MPHDVIDVIDERVKRAGYKPWKGLITFVGPAKAMVVRDGTTTPVPCAYNVQDGVAVGKRCVVDWVPGRQLVITSVSSANNTIEPGDQAPGSLELFAPNNIATSSAIAGCILVTWDVPPQLSVTFEIQRNASAIESGAVTVGSTRGNSYIDTDGVAAYFRVRSLTTLWRFSGWSAWVAGTPGTITGDLSELDDVLLSDLTDEDILTWNATDSRWENESFGLFIDRVLTDDDGEALTDDNGNFLLGDP